MWIILAGVALGVATLLGAWYSLKVAASKSADTDAALAREAQAKRRTEEVEQSALDLETKLRGQENAIKAKITSPIDAAKFLHDSTSSSTSDS